MSITSEQAQKLRAIISDRIDAYQHANYIAPTDNWRAKDIRAANTLNDFIDSITEPEQQIMGYIVNFTKHRGFRWIKPVDEPNVLSVQELVLMSENTKTLP